MSSAPADDLNDRRPKKACTQCRQQKARCDGYTKSAQDSCSRCSKLGLECLVVEGFEREHKRRKLYQLQSETQQLRSQLNDSSTERHLPSTSPTSRAERETTSTRPSHDTVTPGENSAPRMTLPRMMDSVILESDEIDELFQLFFDKYAIFLPILDASLLPNYYYQASPSLFWAVITVASRNYDRKPDLQRMMASKVIDLALLSMKSRVTIRSIQALLILLTWVLSREAGELDPTFLLNGTLLHMSVQLGLHTPVFSQEFSKDRLELTAEELNKRAELWARCVLTYQRSCATKGSPVMALSDITLDPDQRDRLMAILPGDLRFQVRAQDIVARCSAILAKNGLQQISQEQERGMDMTIAGFMNQLDEYQESQTRSTDSDFADCVARLVIHCYYFYLEPDRWSQKANVIAELVSNACSVIETSQIADIGPSTTKPWYYLHGLLHATAVLLRLSKTPSMPSSFDRDGAIKLFHKGVRGLQGMSLDSKDLPARARVILGQLLSSNKAFVHPDSPPSNPQGVPLRIRSRLLMSHVLDAWVWWREEYGGYAGIFPTPLKELQKTGSQVRVQNNPPNAMAEVNGGNMSNVVHQAPEQSFGMVAPSYLNPPYFSGMTTDALPGGFSETWFQNDMFADIGSWPFEDYRIPGL